MDERYRQMKAGVQAAVLALIVIWAAAAPYRSASGQAVTGTTAASTSSTGTGQVSTSITSLLSEDGRIIYDNEPNSITVIDHADNIRRIEEFISTVDVPPQQVLIEARVLEVKLSKEHNLGINWRALADQGGLNLGSLTGTTYTDSAGWAAQGSGIGQGLSALQIASVPGASSGYLDPFTFAVFNEHLDIVLKTLSTVLDTNVLSAPRITTVNNFLASITINKKIPYVVPTDTSTGNTDAVSTSWEVKEKDAGIVLNVTPTINADGLITMLLNPSISDQVSEIEVTSGSTTYTVPIIDSRSASTKVVVSNGQTLIIGGLIKDTVKDQHVKVPLFGDIPVLGYLFKHDWKYREKTELLIMVSATIVDARAIAAMKADYGRVAADAYWPKDRPYDDEAWRIAKDTAQEKTISDPDLHEVAVLTRQIEDLTRQQKELESDLLEYDRRMNAMEGRSRNLSGQGQSSGDDQKR